MSRPTIDRIAGGRLAALIGVLALLGGWSLWAQGSGPAMPMVLVLDASGSMAAKIGGEVKMDIAKRVVGELVNRIEPGAPIGLIAYGHRERNNCADIEVLIPPGPLDRAKFLEAVNGLKPLGMTPLTDAVRLGAEAVGFAERAGAVILVSDGVETCRKDPCALAKELAAKGVGFKTHVIGFDLGSRDLKSIECLARETGGQFLPAKDAAELAAALKVVVEEAAAPKAPVAETGTLELKTLAAEGGKEVEAMYSVRSGDRMAAAGSSGRFKLAPGAYDVTAQWGRASVSSSVAIRAGETTEKVLVLGAGVLKVDVPAKPGGEKLEAMVRVFEIDPDLQGNRTQVAAASAGRDFKLTAGKYWVEAEWGSARGNLEVEVKANQRQDVELVLDAGHLKITTVAVEGGEPVEAFVRVLKPGGPVGREPEQLAASGRGEFRLNAGRYQVESNWGGSAKAVVEVDVRAGEANTATIVLGAGMLRVKALAAAGGEAVDSLHRVFSAKADLSGKRKEVAMGRKDFPLPAGEYLVETQWGQAVGSQKVTVTANEMTEAEIVLNAGTLGVFAKTQDGTRKPAPSSVESLDKDLNGKPKVKQTGTSEFQLPAGKYRVSPRGLESGREVEVLAGQRVEVDF